MQESLRRSPLPLAILAIAFVLVPFLFWRDTWFGRRLTDIEVAKYLQDARHPRKTQHALSQIADRIVQGDPDVRRFYPQLVALASHPLTEIRNTDAWVMGQDNHSQTFHETLRSLLNDPSLMVRRNAALALVRFHDPSARAELVEALRPYTVRAPAGGTVSVRVQPGQRVGAGSLLARVRSPQAGEIEVRAPFSGAISEVRAGNDSRVATGDGLASLSPDADQVWEVLRGLHAIGQPEDLSAVVRYQRPLPEMPERIREQALYTAEAIRTRSERSPTH